jgi:hypothetical protein
MIALKTTLPCRRLLSRRRTRAGRVEAIELALFYDAKLDVTPAE